MADQMVECPSCHKKVLEGSWCPLCGAKMGEFAWLAGLVPEEPPAPFPEAGTPGWFPIAEMPGQQRRWDGYRWTDRYRQAPAAPPDAAPDQPSVEDRATGSVSAVDPVDQLERLVALKTAGGITEAEFDEAKKRILDRI